MFKLAIAALFISSAAAADTLSAGSPKGRALLKHAKVIRPSVHLRRVEEDGDAEGEDGEWADYGDYQYEAEAELDIAQMSIKYLGCSEWQSVDNDWEDNQYEQQVENYYENQEGNADADGGEEAEAEDYQQNNYQNYNDGMVKQSMVRFTLCTSSCGSCSGEYAVDMLEFLDAYTESKMDTLEYQCEMIRERCYCQNGNWEQCFYDCYEQAEFDLYGSDAGVSYCLNQYYGKEAFALQNYLECAEMETANNNNNNNNGYQQEDVSYYVGPYCADNKNIYLGAFYDEDCTYTAKNAKFSSQNYGGSFPYFKSSIVEPNECITCQETESYYQMKQAMKQAAYYKEQAQNQYYGGDGQGYNEENGYNYAYDEEEMDYGDANGICGSSFEDSIKCDESRGYNTGCNFIQKTLPSLDGRGSFSKASADLYDKLRRNKNSAIVMGVIAGLLLGALAFMCGLCGGAGDPKRMSLLEKKRMGDDGQLA